MGVTLILVIFGAFALSGSSGFYIPSLSAVSAVLKLNIGIPNLSSQDYVSSTMSNSRLVERKLYDALGPVSGDKWVNLAPTNFYPLKSPTRHFGKFHKYHHSPPSKSPSTIHQGPSISPSSTSPTPAPSPVTSNEFITTPTSSFVKKKAAPPPPFLALPPPPLNKDCTSMTCTDPLTYTPPGSPCGCVWPIEVRLRLNIAVYTFFPLVTELAKEIASSIWFNQSQVRIMGANAASQEQDQTIVLINLVPLKENFNRSTAFGVYNKFWRKVVIIKPSLFGAYDVVHVQYPGLPPSPPSIPSNLNTMDDVPFPRNPKNEDPIKPIGVDVSGKKKNNSNRSTIIIIVLSSITAFVVCMAFIWLLVLRCGCLRQHRKNQNVSASSHGKPSGDVGSLTMPSSTSMSLGSSLAYTGTAKVFSVDDMERATDHFNSLKILGEGGFGLVYEGILDNGQKVAVKVLKRDDRQGTREFLAEVEMLSRLHHRNLVKLIGICTEDHSRCLVYELVPNGSVESHLHGIDKETSPLDWSARVKIALGSARGLAYLHEDSSPRVIHRDFKSSNILLEHDFTPKVSDFGLAKNAMEGESKHISTHVMGTFGYLAPEYAMTGHLLVKSDVYSYGVVLLELLTGRKPVDLSQPPGQENLVAWARPLLTTKMGLESIIDPSLGPNIPFDSVSKVAAISSMCVQPEVSHRPFMGEVVQALKLVCNEFDEMKENNNNNSSVSRNSSRDRVFVDVGSDRIVDDTSELMGDLGTHYLGFNTETKVALSTPDLVSETVKFEEEFGYFRSEFNSAPLRMDTKKPFWKRLKELSKSSL